MKKHFNHKNKWAILSFVFMAILTLPSVLALGVHAATNFSFTVSPMDENLVLNPGDSYSSSITVYISEQYETKVKYKAEIAPYFVDDDYKNDFSNEYGEKNEIVKWITINNNQEAILSPGEKSVVTYTINVPSSAAGGGQYAAILVSAEAWDENSKNESDNKNNNDQVGVGLIEEKKIAHRIFVEVAGNVTRQGEIDDLEVPGFLLNGDIIATSKVKNTGNTHGEAKYKLQVFPLFSSEEVYTNEEDPATRTILPGRTLLNELTWDKTPAIGIFNVVYTVEFEGVTAQVKKMVIKCPIWLLFIIIFAVILIILYFVLKAKARKGGNR